MSTPTESKTLRRPDHWVPKTAIALAIVGSVSIGWFIVGRSDAVGGATSKPVVVATTIGDIPIDPTSTELTTTTLMTTTVLPALETVVPSVLDTTTLPSPQVPETATPPPATATPSASAIQPDPVPPVFAGPGGHQVMNDPLPSGPAYAQVAAAFGTAQRLADALAAGDWVTARSLLPVDPLDDSSLEFGYGPIDRFSLLLLDARPDGSGYSLLIGAVTNEAGPPQTSLRCLRWYADNVAVDIQSEQTLQTYALQIGPAEIRNDPGEDAKVRTGCVWT